MAKRARKFDRALEDLGNIVELEHVNVTIPNQEVATQFYVTALGLTRDPYLITGVTNMWINVGRSQFHLPTNPPQVLRGCVGLIMPDLKSLVKRLNSARTPLARTKFDFKISKSKKLVEVTCPWGNKYRCHEADEEHTPISLGMGYVQFDVQIGTAKKIAQFYRLAFGTRAFVEKWDGATSARVSAGHQQELIFRESKKKLVKFDGHHIQIYVADFSAPHKWLREHGLITEESNRHQYRFLDIVDVDDGSPIFSIEHEVRSMTHPLYGRPKVNRNPDQTNRSFAHGHETISWAAPMTGSS